MNFHAKPEASAPERRKTALIAEALNDALGDPQLRSLAHHLGKHGFVIVEAARHDKLLTTLQLVGSVLEPIVAGMGAREFPPGVWRLLQDVVTKIGEL